MWMTNNHPPPPATKATSVPSIPRQSESSQDIRRACREPPPSFSFFIPPHPPLLPFPLFKPGRNFTRYLFYFPGPFVALSPCQWQRSDPQPLPGLSHLRGKDCCVRTFWGPCATSPGHGVAVRRTFFLGNSDGASVAGHTGAARLSRFIVRRSRADFIIVVLLCDNPRATCVRGCSDSRRERRGKAQTRPRLCLFIHIPPSSASPAGSPSACPDRGQRPSLSGGTSISPRSLIAELRSGFARLR